MSEPAISSQIVATECMSQIGRDNACPLEVLNELRSTAGGRDDSVDQHEDSNREAGWLFGPASARSFPLLAHGGRQLILQDLGVPPDKDCR
jgi:hypothetical protein